MRLRAEEVRPKEEVIVVDWEAEAKVLRQQIVELEGQRKSLVLSRVTRRQTTSLWRRSSIVSPTPLGVVVCEASGVERRSGNGRPIDCCGAHSAFGCRWCQDAGDVRCNMTKNGKREMARYGMRACRVGEASHQGLSAVDGSVPTIVPVRRGSVSGRRRTQVQGVGDW